VFAIAGGMLDERVHLGFTQWRSACRAAGLSLQSLVHFTLELLPTAVIGALAGGLVVLAFAAAARHRAPVTGTCLAAHAGCAVAMPLGLILCTFAVPIPVMFVAEVTMAVIVAGTLQAVFPRRIETRVPLHP
jgi:hypothetical protein